MNDDEKKNPGAASGDDTSALFVSARKKQLAEQEAQRKVAEEEAKRRAAEEEVRRLEAEVAERKRQAEEEARRIAEEARAQKAEAAANPDAILGVPPAEKAGKGASLPHMPTISVPKPNIGSAWAEKFTQNPKMLKIIGGAVVLLLVLVLFISWGGDKSDKGDLIDEDKAAAAANIFVDVNAAFDKRATLSSIGMVVNYPSSIFTVKSATPTKLELTAGEDDHAVLMIFTSGQPAEKPISTKEQMIAALEADNKQMVAGMLKTVADPVVLSQKAVNPRGNVWQYLTTATFQDNGEEAYLYWWTGAWTMNKQSYVYEYVFACKTSLAVKYLPLVEKIWEKKADVK
ncbi:MAG TPA: hypothetical protein VN462_08770 [Negativicutes bacterium]|nr:hypothetical protein [Negativicutes bacterium]